MAETIIDFRIGFLDQTIYCMDGATLEKRAPFISSYDAKGVFYVNLQDMKNVFKYQTDSSDMNNFNADDIKYYVCMDNWPKNLILNPAHAMMFDFESKNGYDISDPSIPNSKKLVKHDFIRYLALKLFNTTRGVNLMANEFELIENLAGDGSIFTNKCAYNILDKLNKISTTSTDASMNDIDNSGNKYLTNSTETSNIVRSIMEQINYLNPERFNSLVDTSDNTLMRSIPFKVGDRLSFSFTIKPAANQHLLTGVPLIPDRIYLISLIIGENVQLTNKNLQVMDSAFIGDFPYSKYSPDIILNNPAIYGTNSPPSSIPTSFGYLNSGWYFSSVITGSTSTKINWSILPSSGAKFNDLNYIYITGQLLTNQSIPSITIYAMEKNTDMGSGVTLYEKPKRIYSYDGPSIIPGNYQVVVQVNPVVVCPAIDGYKQIILTYNKNNDLFPSLLYSGQLLNYSIESNTMSSIYGNVKIILNSFCANDVISNNLIPVKYFQTLTPIIV